jgi:hypothetical protein
MNESRRIAGRVFARALADAGIVTDLNSIYRIVIDVRSDRPVEIHVVHFGDERLLDGFADMLTMDNELAPSSPPPQGYEP